MPEVLRPAPVVLPVFNLRATGVDNGVIAKVNQQLDGFAVRNPVVLLNGTSPEESDRSLQDELAFLATQPDTHVVVVVGGDGTMQWVRQRIHEIENPGNILPVHVATGLVNANIGIYGTKVSEIARVLRDGSVITVDHIEARATNEQGDILPPHIALLAVGGQDPEILCRIEETRKKGKVGVIEKLFAGALGVRDMYPIGTKVTRDGGVIFDDTALATEAFIGPNFLHVPVADGMDGYMTVIVVPARRTDEGVANTIIGTTLAVIGFRENNQLLQQYKGQEFDINYTEPVRIHVDAEVQGHVVGVNLKIIPDGTRFLVPARH